MGRSSFNSNIKTKTKGGFMLKISGVNEILRNLELTKNQSARLHKFLKDEANKIKATAQEMVPEDTGRLKESHRVESSRSSRKDLIAVDILVGGIVVKDRMVSYAAAVHEGYTVKSGPFKGRTGPPRPWLANALKRHEAGYKSRLKKAIKIYGRSG